jgi:hypothetical protein
MCAQVECIIGRASTKNGVTTAAIEHASQFANMEILTRFPSPDFAVSVSRKIQAISRKAVNRKVDQSNN